MLDGKQIKDGTIALAKLAAGVLTPFLRADGTVSWTSAQNAGSQRLTNLGAPTQPSDAARLQDLQNLPYKEKCLCATTANVNLATVGLSAQDGITPLEGSRVVVWK